MYSVVNEYKGTAAPSRLATNTNWLVKLSTSQVRKLLFERESGVLKTKRLLIN